jgi:ELWxxDGT repeat protein
LTRLGKRLYFSADDGVSGLELWTTKGTGKSTRRLKDLQPGPGGAFPSGFARLAKRLYFAADDGSRGRELWVTNGKRKGTRLVKDINPAGGSVFCAD